MALDQGKRKDVKNGGFQIARRKNSGVLYRGGGGPGGGSGQVITPEKKQKEEVKERDEKCK